MKKIALAAALAVGLIPAVCAAQTKTPRRVAALPAGPVETLRVSALNLDEEGGTTFTFKDAKGVKLEPVTVPLAICRKDHLGRLLPGLDVQMVVETKKGADGKTVRYVRPERLRPWCN